MEGSPKLEPNREVRRRYIYREYTSDKKIVFECIAKDILEADKKYQEEIGEDPRRQNHIGCFIEEVET